MTLPDLGSHITKIIDYEKMDFDKWLAPIDSVSTLAMRDYARPSPPALVLFCGGIDYTFAL
jgi:hypothetical protein